MESEPATHAEKLDAAEKLWDEKGPKSYKMIYTKNVHGEKSATFAVTVHDKKVTDVMMDGVPLKQKRRTGRTICGSTTAWKRSSCTSADSWSSMRNRASRSEMLGNFRCANRRCCIMSAPCKA